MDHVSTRMRSPLSATHRASGPAATDEADAAPTTGTVAARRNAVVDREQALLDRRPDTRRRGGEPFRERPRREGELTRLSRERARVVAGHGAREAQHPQRRPVEGQRVACLDEVDGGHLGTRVVEAHQATAARTAPGARDRRVDTVGCGRQRAHPARCRRACRDRVRRRVDPVQPLEARPRRSRPHRRSRPSA